MIKAHKVCVCEALLYKVEAWKGWKTNIALKLWNTTKLSKPTEFVRKLGLATELHAVSAVKTTATRRLDETKVGSTPGDMEAVTITVRALHCD